MTTVLLSSPQSLKVIKIMLIKFKERSNKDKMKVSYMLITFSILLAYAGTHNFASEIGSENSFLAMPMLISLYISGLIIKSCKTP